MKPGQICLPEDQRVAGRTYYVDKHQADAMAKTIGGQVIPVRSFGVWKIEDGKEPVFKEPWFEDEEHIPCENCTSENCSPAFTEGPLYYRVL